MIIINYLEQGSTISGAYYARELRRLRQEIARKMRGQLTHGVLLLLDKAPTHKSQVAMTAATECGFEIFPHSPYSLDMAPPDFYLFPKLISYLRGTQYVSNEGIKEPVNEYLGTKKTPSILKE